MEQESENFKEGAGENFDLSETNEIQMDLMKESDLPPEDWAKIYAKDFRDIVTEDEPHLKEVYKKDHKLAEEAIKEKLYSKKKVA